MIYSCQSDESEVEMNSRNTITKSTWPLIKGFSSASTILSVDAKGTCFTVQIDITVHWANGSSGPWATFISTGGPGCPPIISSPGGGSGPGGSPAVSSYEYKGEWIEDAEIGGVKVSDIFDEYPEVYQDYLNTKSKAISSYGI